jgi:RNA polymerase sigma-70 factor (ECF subfamily)
MTAGLVLGDLSDEELFSRVAAGDASAFAAFYERHEGLLYGLALRIIQDPVEAEDALQEAALLLWERSPQYDPSLGRPLSWAVTLVRNKAIDRLRATRRRGDVLERVANEFAAGEKAATGVERALPGGDTLEIVRRTLHILPTEQRRAIELAFFAGLTQSEIAQHLEQPLGTIKARIRRGMLTMRDALEGAL